MASSDLKELDDGNNYVHKLMSSAGWKSPEEVIYQLIKHLSDKSKESIIQLLDERNIYGNTPLHELLDCHEPDEGIIKILISKGSDINASDCLGMTPIYKIVKELFLPNRIIEGQYLGEEEEKIVNSQRSKNISILKLFLSSGVDVNKADIFGQTPLFLANDIEVIQLLKDNGGDLCITDRCGRSILHSSFSMPNCEHLARIYISTITTCCLQKADCFGSTALHYSALFNKRDLFNDLIKNGKIANVTDCEGNTPVKIFELNNSSEEFLYARKPEYHKQLVASKKVDQVHFNEIIQAGNLSELIKKAENASEVISLLKSPGFGAPTYNNESESIKTAVVDLAHRLCQIIGQLDPRLKCSLFRTGSSEEGTKVGDPFEFDFVFCLDRVAELCDVVESEIKPNFAELKVSNRIPKEFAPFFDKNGKCEATNVRLSFGKVLRRFVANKDTWTNNQIYFDGDVMHLKEYDRPVFTLKIRWLGCMYKYQEISIDVCPAFRKIGWWPSGTDFNSIDMMSSEIRAEGCLLLLQNPYDESNTLLRISCAPADISLMKSIPSTFRESYRLCKLLRHEALCPSMDVDSLTDDFPLLTADDCITSYMLKNSLFYILGGYSKNKLLKESIGPKGDAEIVSIASNLLKFLDQCLFYEKFPVFFLQKREDIFRTQFAELDSEEEVQTYIKFHCPRRRAFVKILLHHLGQ